MQKWTKPELLDLKITLTAGFYGGLKAETPSFHTVSPRPTQKPLPSFNPSEVLDLTDLEDDEY